MIKDRHLPQARVHFPLQTCSQILGLQEDKNTSVLYELVDFIKVIQIKMFALGKELHFIGVSLGDFVVMAQCGIVALTLRLEEVFDFVPRLAWITL